MDRKDNPPANVGDLHAQPDSPKLTEKTEPGFLVAESIPHVSVKVETHPPVEVGDLPAQEHSPLHFYRRLKYRHWMPALVYTIGLIVIAITHFQGRIRAYMVSSMTLMAISIIVNMILIVTYQDAKEDPRKSKLFMVLNVSQPILVGLSILLSFVALFSDP